MNAKLRRLVLAGFVLAVPATPLAAQTVRVNGPLMRYPIGAETVQEFQHAPAEGLVVFVACPEDYLRPELFVAPIDGSGPWRRLSTAGGTSYGPLVVGGGNVLFMHAALSPAAVHAVPLDGSTPPVSVSPPRAPHGRIERYAVAAGRAVTLGDPSAGGVTELFSAPLDGSAAPLALAAPLVAGGGVRGFELSSDGLAVIFTADRITAGVVELWGVPADGSAAPVRLSGPLVAGGDVRDFVPSPGGGRVVYTADALSDEVLELWSAPLDGSAAPVRLNPALVPGGDVQGLQPGRPFHLTADGATVVYEADQQSDDVFELWAVPSDGGAAAIRLGSPLVAGGDVRGGVRISPDGTRVVYLADRTTPGVVELLSAPLAGGASAWLNASQVSTLGGPFVFDVAADGARVVFWAMEEAEGVHGLWSVPIQGGAEPVRLVPLGPEQPELEHFRLAGSHALFRSSPSGDEGLALWSVPVAGGAGPLRLTPLALHGEVLASFEPAGARALYIADAVTDTAFALWSVPVAGGAAPLELSVPLDPGVVCDSVQEFAWASGGARLLYSADGYVDARHQQPWVFSVDLAGLERGGPLPVVHVGAGGSIRTSADCQRAAFHETLLDEGCTMVNDPCTLLLRTAPSDGSEEALFLAEGLGYLPEVRFGAGGTRLVYVNTYWIHGPPWTVSGLFVVPVDGSAPAIRVSSSGSFELSPDGEHLVYVERSGERDHLYVVPVDLSLPPRELNPPLFDPAQSIRAFRIAPDGASLVFQADLYEPGTFELHLVPLDGSAAPVRLGQAGVPGLVHESDFRISRDGAQLVYVLARELWCTPLDAARGQAPVRLSAKAFPGGGLAPPVQLYGEPGPRSEFELAPDGSAVVYRAELAYGRFELFAVPIDGSLPPVPLHGPLTGGRAVVRLGYQVTADSSRVVFAADLIEQGARSLYAVPITGGVAPIDLCGAFVAGGGPWLPEDRADGFRITPDGDTVVYAADQRFDNVIELFAVPIHGGRAPRRLSPPLGPDGDVLLPFEFSPDGEWVAYLAGQTAVWSLELFVSAPDPQRFQRVRPRQLR